MSVIQGNAFSDDEVDTGDIGHSLRFRSAASAYLSRTPGSAGDRTKWTWSGWVKRGTLGVQQILFLGNAGGSDANYTRITLNSSDNILINGYSTNWRVTSRVLRDPTAHTHLVVVYDSGNATAGDRIKLYVNGVQETAFTTTNNPSLSATSGVNAAAIHYISRNDTADGYLDGYLSRICLIDGAALTPDSFGYLNTTINEWVSLSQSAVKAVVDAGGTNSFMLDFDDATSLTTLGYDKSTKGNNWTLNNFSLTAGTTYDHMLDVPGNSFATLNPLATYTSGTASEANLKLTTGTTHCYWTGSQAMSSGKWYWEVTDIADTPGVIVGVAQENKPTNVELGDASYGYGYQNSGNKKNSASSSAYGASYTNNDVIGVALDLDAGTLTFYKNGTTQGTAFSGLTGSFVPALGDTSNAGSGGIWNLNFGQAPLHASATYHSAAGGYFRDAPSTGFKALCQRNLPEVSATLLDPTDHHIDIAVTKSGDTNFTLPWNADTYDTFFEIKRRDAAGDWYQIDGLRGYTKILKSNSTAAETTDANVLGISGTTGTLKSTLADGTYIVSATKAGLSASRQTNTDGSITSTVSRNVDSGFSIVTYTGTSANATVGHGLGKALAQFIVKDLTSGSRTASQWPVFHTAMGATKSLFLNATDSAYTNSGTYNNTAPTTSVFSVGTWGGINYSGDSFVAYCYADSAIQKSFSYTGNGSADGPYANLGFKCGRGVIKASSAAEQWGVVDSVRSPDNPSNEYLILNSSDAEDTPYLVDLLAMSIKPRVGAGYALNGSGTTYIGHAWAAVTGKYSLGR